MSDPTELHDPATPTTELDRRAREHDGCTHDCHAGERHGGQCNLPGGCWPRHAGAPHPDQVCVLGCRDRTSPIWPRPPRRRAEGLLTCRPCADSITGRDVDGHWRPGLLDDLLELASVVALYLQPGNRILDPEGRTPRRRPASPAPLNVPVASLSDARSRTDGDDPTPANVVAFLDSWADRIRLGRQLGAGTCSRCAGQLEWRRALVRWPRDAAWPALLTQCTVCGDRRPAFADDSSTVLTALTLLRRHNEWICTQPWVTRYSTGLHGLREELRRASGIVKAKRIGTCPNTIDARRGTTCGAPLVAHPDDRSTTCRACGREYERAEWRHLGNLMNDEHRRRTTTPAGSAA